jgi:dihydrofolate reductase
MIILIAAVAENNALGKDNKIIWHLPNDFKRFKQLTTNHHIIMGRKTFESFPKPLPNRTHIVISRQQNYNPEGCIVVKNLQEALDICPKSEDFFIIGGAQIYELALPFCDILEITRVHESFDADAFFPEIDLQNWELVATNHQYKDDKHLIDYSYETYFRNKERH